MAPKTPKLTAFCRTFALSNKSIQGWVSTHTDRLTHILHYTCSIAVQSNRQADSQRLPQTFAHTHTHTQTITS